MQEVSKDHKTFLKCGMLYLQLTVLFVLVGTDRYSAGFPVKSSFNPFDIQYPESFSKRELLFALPPAHEI